MRYVLPLIVAIPLLLTACSTTHHKSGQYFQNDGPPSADQADGADAQPRVEPFKEGTLRPYTVLGKTYVPITEDIPFTQTGVGSWYGKQFHGKRTATGETYDMFAMTAAHPTLPLPSYAQVTNLDNGKSIIVRVNDRGPFLNSRVIDLSYGAARRLGYANKGTAHVRVKRLTFNEIRSGQYNAPSTPGSTQVASAPVVSAADEAPNDVRVNAIEATPAASAVISPRPSPAPTVSSPSAEPVMPDMPGGTWGVQIGFFSTKDNAQAFLAHAQATLSSMGEQVTYRIVNDNNGYRVILGRYGSQSTARSAAQAIGSNLGVSAFPIQK